MASTHGIKRIEPPGISGREEGKQQVLMNSIFRMENCHKRQLKRVAASQALPQTKGLRFSLIYNYSINMV